MRKLKIILFLVLSGILVSSCGPRRLGCGPNRCFIETEKEIYQKPIKNPEKHCFSGLV